MRDFTFKLEPLFSSLKNFSNDLKDWADFLYRYSKKRLIIGAVNFEQGKDVLVDILLAKRGRYRTHFLNISFLFIIAGAVVGGPVIADYYPTIEADRYGGGEETAASSSALIIEDVVTTTALSDKPRFEIIDYEVAKGDTLGGVAEKFGVSIDTIKWANSLKTEKLVPGQTLRIPPVTGIVHKVAPGDTIYSLAKKYKSDPQKIVNFPVNDFSDLDTICFP